MPHGVVQFPLLLTSGLAIDQYMTQTSPLQREMEANNYYSSDEDAIENLLANDDRTNAAYMSTILSIIGLLISTATAFVAILSYTEDRLMKRYREHGEIVHAEVISTYFTRGNISSHDEEYSICVDYFRELTKYYVVRIRKTVKVKSESIVHPLSTQAKHVILYVIPEYHKSGYPKDTVDNKCSQSYQTSTVALILLAEMVSLSFFLFPIMRFLHQTQDEDNDNKTLVLSIFGSFFILAILMGPLLYFSLGNILTKALYNEHFESGDILPAENDMSTIISSEIDTRLQDGDSNNC